MRPIDADALSIAKFVAIVNDCDYAKGWNDAIGAIMENAPTVNAAPERTGTWSEEYHPENDLFLRRIYRCSACNGWNTYGFPRYCPDCGAKMLNATALTREVNNE